MACGTCTMCCKLLGVEELAKPVNTWCGHCDKGRGCSIYAARPKSCVEFECVWLIDQLEQGGKLPAALRPDRSHVVFMTKEGYEHQVVAHVDPAYPDAWREGEVQTMIAGLAGKGITTVIRSKGRTIVVDEHGVFLAEVVGTIEGISGSEKLRKVRRVGHIGKAA